MKAQKSGLLAAETHIATTVAQVENRGKAASDLHPTGARQNKVSLPFGYGKGSVPYLAPDFDALLEDFRKYSS